MVQNFFRYGSLLPVLTALAWLSLKPQLAGGVEQQLNGQKFILPDGFEIVQAAGSDLVERPISVDFDEQGRLYVTESSGTNDKAEIQLANRPHRVLRLEDTDGDGVFDRRTVFADQLMLPEGALWHQGALYVSAPPQHLEAGRHR